MKLTGYAAVWHDDSTETYGTERVFLSRARLLYCMDYIMHALNDEEAVGMQGGN